MVTVSTYFQEHTHIGGEEFMVLEGTFKDQFGEFPKGTYVRNPIGSKHSPWVDEDGCTIMVKLLQMAETGEGTTPLHVNVDQEKDSKGIETDYGTVLEMYSNASTGERVQMCWIKPNTSFIVDDLSKGGEELFIMEGELLLSSSDEAYQKWGWLRFPTDNGESERRSQLKAGSSGAQVLRKTGHLTEKALGMEKIQISED